jgi:release factor glutamine methyltransferase
MDVTAPLVRDAFELLAPGGTLVVEVGTQASLVRDAFVARGYEGVTVRRDLAGLDRVVTGRRPS